ncbi:MAG: hypothetical protein J2P24_17600 [Streptosporangiales bacterium]|nr:hypothetical protein [Streptosporangiales bacterium]MBO0890311.1 hypothetical protein [Acidothermales bacterium]
MGNAVTVTRSTAVPVLFALRVVTSAGLAADAVVHFHLARNYDVVAGGISQGTLFRAESVVALAVAVLVLAVRRWWTDALAFLVAASALVAVLASTYVHLGAIGPIPDMYEPIWYAEKTLVTVAEVVAAVAALASLVLALTTRGHRRRGFG